jgi:hypothetical protein
VKVKPFVYAFAIFALIISLDPYPAGGIRAKSPDESDKLNTSSSINGPFLLGPVTPVRFQGDLRDLPRIPPDASAGHAIPLLTNPEKRIPAASADWTDAVAQIQAGSGQMPAPIANFAGLDFSNWGAGWPPDTNGDVGPDHYIQTVNISIGIYDKTGSQLAAFTFDNFFAGTGTPCDYSNDGDPIALYDALADRWLIADFSLPNGGPYYECIAVSQTGDPVSGGWYFYAFVAGFPGQSWHDYPKLGVWPDAYYMSANMFDPWIGARVWALDRDAMLNGQPLTGVYFNAGSAYGGLLPANLRGDLPPAGSPDYFASIDFPNTLHLWKFHVDWNAPANSTFTGPTNLTVADFGFIANIPQPPPGENLDSLGDRLMMQLQYRNLGDHEALWVNHTVASNGAAGIRWYEVRDPGGTPTIYQQGTYQPDSNYRWMGSLAVDQDGNMALGYSISSTTLKPGIRYTGRLAGETPGILPQGEASLIDGAGVQTSGYGRWGDYSAMSIDPMDDCTFWYTQEYYKTTSNNWQTRIGSFRFPSCGQPKGWIGGMVYDATTLEAIPGAPVAAESLTVTFNTISDANGYYTMTLPAGTYTLTGGPLLPGYPNPATIPDLVVTAGQTIAVDIPLAPQPELVGGNSLVDDNVPGGNGNSYPEPGESGLLLWQTITNTGTTTATHISAQLVSLTPGVNLSTAEADYADLAAGQAGANLTSFVFSIDPSFACGGRFDFQETLNSDQGIFTVDFSLYAKVPLPRASIFFDDMEAGSGQWTTGGTNNRWALSTESYHSPTHAWSDSPAGNYYDNTNAWLKAPAFNLSGKTDVKLEYWHRYALESGYDFGYLEYSLNGGTSWQVWQQFTSTQAGWVEVSLDGTVFENQPNVTFRYRLASDQSVTEDGWHIDDVDLSYVPFECTYQVTSPEVPVLITPPDGAVITTTQSVTLTWEAGQGAPPTGYNLNLDGRVITTTNTYTTTTLDAGTHTWQVRAYNESGYSDYSAAWTFEIAELPGVPVLLGPVNGLITTTQSLTLTWEAGPGGLPTSYDVEVDGMVTNTVELGMPVTFGTGLHSWRVRALNQAGASDYSDSWSLEILTLPGVPILLVPADGTVTADPMVTLTWENGIGSPADSYDVELDGVVTTVTAKSMAVTLDPGVHIWRVRANNLAGTSAYSETWAVTILNRTFLPLVTKR